MPEPSEERYGALFEAIQDGILIVDNDGRFIEVNEGFCRILGASRDQLIGAPFSNFLPAGRLAEAVDALARLKEDAVTPVEFPLQAIDGRIVELEWSSSAHYLPGLCFCACRDVSERKRSQQALEASEARYRALVEASGQYVWTADAAGHTATVPAWWNDVTGQPHHGRGGWEWLAAVHPDDRMQVKQQWTASLEAQTIFKTVCRVLTGSASYRHFSIYAVPVASSDGTFREWVGTFNDVTERKLASDAVAVSAAKLRAYFETASQGIVRVDERGRIEELNAKLLELFGYRREELIGRDLNILVPESLRVSHAAHLAQYFRSPIMRPMGVGVELTARHKDGHHFPAEIALSYVETPEGIRALAFISDITERKRAEAALRERQKFESLGILAGGIAHDFNNLLVGIMGNASLLAGTQLPAGSRETVSEILQASQRAADLTRQLLAYAGKGRFVMRPVDVSKLAREIRTMMQGSIAKKVDLRLHLDDEAPRIHADSAQIQQVITNLVMNASEAIPVDQPGLVEVATSSVELDELHAQLFVGEGHPEPGTYLKLEVRDTGEGMDKRVLSRIFDPFFTTKFMGRGLGLSAVQGIVRAHGGALRVESHVGEGTTFQVLFPAMPAPLAPEGKADYGDDLRGDGLILVVDDEGTVRRAAKLALERWGYHVLLAPDGPTAVELFRDTAHDVDLVLLDLSMPEMGGEETLRRLQSIRPDIRVVLSSGYNESEAISQFTDQNLAGFIQKPYTVLTLARKIKAAMA